ncbi:MAG: LD-carboxypeptidase [Treponema sp.]|nr:MAG: LD-carboxypeptidase [Treponema sp.]
MILPDRLKYGDTIAFFSPSSAATYWAPKRFERAKKFLENKGFNLVAGKLTGKSDYYRSGNIRERVDELNELIANKNVKCIMSTIGGMNSNSLLPYIDYDKLKENPKIIIGYSDMTAILFGIYSKIGLVTFYGPALVASFGEMGRFLNLTFEYFEKAVIKPDLPYLIENPKFWTDEFIDWEKQDREKKYFSNQLITVNDGVANGRLIAGNLNTMSGIFGSEYMPKIKEGDILLIEDSLKDASSIERAFAHFKISGVFDKLGGLILGKHELFDDKDSKRKPYEIMLEVIGERSYPILAEYDCSHTHPMITLPIGAKVKLDATNQSLTIQEKYLN